MQLLEQPDRGARVGFVLGGLDHPGDLVGDVAVPADQTYGDWIKKQPAARQDQIVGATRGALMREGKLPFDALYTPRGEYLTLEQLRERNGAAFDRAGV